MKYNCRICNDAIGRGELLYGRGMCFSCQAAEVIKKRGEKSGWMFVDIAMTPKFNLKKEKVQEKFDKFFK